MPKRLSLTFPLVFELLIWLFYVCMYKYSHYLDMAQLPLIPGSSFPYLQICLFCICSTLYLIPYYRWMVPRLLFKKRYWILFGLTIVIFVFVSSYNQLLFAWIFAKFTTGLPVHAFFANYAFWRQLDFNLLMTDLLAFFCIAFARFSYQNEQLRHKIETDNLQLQLGMLKAQLQPHFLFNTLNGLYGMSLTGSKETPRFILLLSQMMQYILYDCDKETVNLQDEADFLTGYFELEQKKFPKSNITFHALEGVADLTVPPLLFLPLVENSFKHGRHKLEDKAGVEATLTTAGKTLTFTIKNEVLPPAGELQQKKIGGIGLININKRLELYYPNRHQLSLTENDGLYIAELTLQLK